MTSDFAPIDAETRCTLERELADLRGKRDKLAASLPPENADDRLAESLRLEPLDARIAEIVARLHWSPPADQR